MNMPSQDGLLRALAMAIQTIMNRTIEITIVNVKSGRNQIGLFSPIVINANNKITASINRRQKKTVHQPGLPATLHIR
jgi:hypothetical protein